jgi:hypothetical protein
LVDTEADNQRAIQFFRRHGFAQPRSHVWLSKSLTRNHVNVPKPSVASTSSSRQKAEGRKKISPGPSPMSLSQNSEPELVPVMSNVTD